MKNIYFFTPTLILILILDAHSQNVGIGINSPQNRLHVHTPEVDGSILITNVTTAASNLDGLRLRIINLNGYLDNLENGDLSISTNKAQPGFLGIPEITIKPTGAVGIGTTNPGAKLEVTGQVKITGGSPGAGKVLTSDATGLASWAVPISSSKWATNGLNIYNANSGFVGVGTNTPNYSLQVHHNGVGNKNGASIQLTNNWSGSGINDGLTIGLMEKEDEPTLILNRENGDLVFSTNNGAGGALGIPQIWIRPSGAIGIGTSTPGAKLEILGVGADQPALNINNGFLKVSGANPTAFKHTTTVGNITNHFTALQYNGQASTDMLTVTHVYNNDPSTILGNYLTKPIGVWWNGTNWNIYVEDQTPFIVGLVFNVLVIKQ